MTFTVFISVGVPPCSVTAGVVGLLFYGFSLGCCCFGSFGFLSTLSNAQLGYLHLVRDLLRCCISLIRSSGPVQTVLALWSVY